MAAGDWHHSAGGLPRQHRWPARTQPSAELLLERAPRVRSRVHMTSAAVTNAALLEDYPERAMRAHRVA